MSDSLLFQRAYCLYTAGQFAAAERTLRTELAEEPDEAWNHGLLADGLLRLGRVQEAKPTVAQAIKLEPQESYFHYVLSIAHSIADDLDSAETSIQKAIELKFSNPVWRPIPS